MSDPSMDELRTRSRQHYLEKRETQKLKELKDSIKDEELLFDGDELTPMEHESLKLKKTVSELANARLQLQEQEKRHQYAMPQNYIEEKKREKRQEAERAAFARYISSPREKEKTKEEDWEVQQLAKTLPEETTEFEYLFDTAEHVRFTVPEQDPQLEHDRVHRQATIQEKPQENEGLPIEAYRHEFIEAIKSHQILIVVGETGSGKTTQIPQYLIKDLSPGIRVVVTQPRRVAAISVAIRVSQELKVRLGREVGYVVRFEERYDPLHTRISFMTDGVLLREFLTNPDLGSYDVVMIDEAHERTIHTDVLLSLIKDLSLYRPELRIIISSATLDAGKFSAFFNDAPIFMIPGRPFPVEIFYCEQPEADYVSATITTIMQIHITQKLPGDILAFLTGQEEIEMVATTLASISKALGRRIAEMIIIPIYAALGSEQQVAIFAQTPQGARKIVLATNIAETSLTIPGITHVIDPGLVKTKWYEWRTGIESLLVVPCSQASAAQRSGRAGRMGPGRCFRLYTKWSWENELAKEAVPEIQRSDLAGILLLLKSIGIDDLLNFDWIDPPAPEAMIRALELLYAIGALSKEGGLTQLGKQMAALPLDPRLAITLLRGEELGVGEEVIAISSMLSIQDSLFIVPSREARNRAEAAKRAFYAPEGDHIMLLRIWLAFHESGMDVGWCRENYIQFKSMQRAMDVADQLRRLMARIGFTGELSSNVNDLVSIRKAFVTGYFYHAARLNASGDGYKLIKGDKKSILIHPSSCLYPHRNSRGDTHKNNNDDHGDSRNTHRSHGKPEKHKERGMMPPKWILFHEVVLTSREYMRQVIAIDPLWLREVAPHFYSERELDLDRKAHRRR